MTDTTMPARPPMSPAERKAIGLVVPAHFLSHIYMLVLPPLFPLLASDLRLGFTELGLLLTVFMIISAFGQVPAGAFVDRFGARRLLAGALALIGAAYCVMGGAALTLGADAALLEPLLAFRVPLLGAAVEINGFWLVLLLMMALAGLGNTVIHPADYSIMVGSVSEHRIGRVFSVHTAAGFAGFAVTPGLMWLLSDQFGWQTALVVIGFSGLAMASALLLLGRGIVEGSRGKKAAKAETQASTTGSKGAGIDTLRIILAPPLIMFFLFNVMAAMGNSGVNNFAVAILVEGGVVDLGMANLLLTVFLVAGTLGILAGGVIADFTKRHEAILVIGFVVSGAALILPGVMAVPALGIALILAIAGFGTGTIRPSRDMMVRDVTPPGATGKVFGFVTTGLNAGAAVAPVLYGLLIDSGHPDLVFVAVAICLQLALLAALVGRALGRRGLGGAEPAPSAAD